MKTAALIDDKFAPPPLNGFTKAPTASRKAKNSKKPVPFEVRWRNQIAGDRSLTALAIAAAILLADYYDEEQGCAWPSQERLAARLNASRGGVRQAIGRLEAAGYLEYVPECGRKRTNRYFLRCPEPKNGH